MLAAHSPDRADSRSTLRVLIAGGGTGGHVYPGLAVAEALQAQEADIRFAGTRHGLESVLIPRAGYRLYQVPASGFRGLGPGARIRFIMNMIAGIVRSTGIMLRWRPTVVLGTGGYASAPVLAAARLLGCPTALQEQNAIPGSANRLLARWASRIYLGFPEAAAYFPGRSCLVTGNPVRASFSTGSAPPVSEKEVPPHLSAPVDTKELRVLIFGGSRGARTLNLAVGEAAPLWRDLPLALWIQTGIEAREQVARAYADYPQGQVQVTKYLFDMPAALAWADLAICRAGAMTLAELQAMGKPAILVPFPHATDDHQLKNAMACAEAGAALVVPDAECTGSEIVTRVQELAADRERLNTMGHAAAGLARPGAAATIARDLLILAKFVPTTDSPEATDVS